MLSIIEHFCLSLCIYAINVSQIPQTLTKTPVLGNIITLTINFQISILVNELGGRHELIQRNNIPTDISILSCKSFRKKYAIANYKK